ncbi:MAG: hypothetical protein HKN79_10080 [Flavobacteriales bacterium]|nr:hypothetical protein [Flavobacteriales bacterium]
MNRIWIIVALVVCAAQACKHDPILDELIVEDPIDTTGGGPDTTVFQGNPCDPDSVYFVNEILPFLTASCAQPGCHDAATAEDGVVLDSYFNIVTTGDVEPFDPADSEIYETITDSDLDDRMPPAGEDPLTAEQIQMIYDWIAQGAQDNSCSSCDTTEVTFAQTIYPIIELKCQGCHSGAQPSSGLSLEDYGDISTIAISGALYSSITGSNGYPLMPYNSNALPACEIDLIQTWILEGAPDN